MPAWLTVYCVRSIGDLAADDIRTGIEDADYLTIAEGFGIEDEEIDRQAVKQLRIHPASGFSGLKCE